MYCLNDKQIDYILSDIGARGVEMDSLRQNLLDHVCCIIEQNLEENGDFENFYQKTIKTFYKDELWEIEEETLLLLTYKNYYTMKKIMIISGIFSAITLNLGTLFEFMHWPGTGMLIVITIFLICFIFLPLLFMLKAKEKENAKDKLIIGFATLSGILMSLSILFKIMHWPGSFPLVLITITVLGLLFLPIYFFNGIRNPDKKMNTIVMSIIVITICGLCFSLVNSRPKYSIENSSIPLNQKLTDSYEYATKENKMLLTLLVTDSLSEKNKIENLSNKCNVLCNNLEQLKLQLGSIFDEGKISKINYATLPIPDNYDVPTHYLFEDGTTKPKEHLTLLKQELKNFNEFITSTYKKNSFELLNLSDFTNTETGKTETWEVTNFSHVPLINVLRNLTQLQLNIRLIEAQNLR